MNQISNITEGIGSIQGFLNEKFSEVFAMLESIKKDTKFIAIKSLREKRTESERMPYNKNQRTSELLPHSGSQKILESLPLRSIEQIVELDLKLVTDDAFKSQFVAYLSQIGGNSIKEKIVRLLEKVFDNQVAKQCSWMGHQNFIVGPLKLMTIIQEVARQDFLIIGREFEEVTSEWFRQAEEREQTENMQIINIL
ncbi:hypothetical protein JTB14_033068 [Gonioctena quinquepunctata]|nr:hypothetical protein JTB14_033068 [Gonioctena quinquepunctata]